MARKIPPAPLSAASVLATIAAAKGAVLDFYLPPGHGKTALSLTAPFYVPGCQKALLIVPPAAMRHFKGALENFSDYRGLDAPLLEIVSHNDLSKPDGVKMLAAWEPDLIICDQWAPDLARHRRLFNYVEARGDKVTVVRWTVGP